MTGQRAAVPSLGALGDRPTLDTPFTVSTYDAELIKDIQAVSLTDVVKLDPAATTFLSQVNEGSDFLIRGFSVQTYYMDSVPGLGGTRSDPPLELYDGVQILKGAAGFLFGFTSPGGIVNFVSKRPNDEAFVKTQVGYATDSLWRGHVDASAPVLGDLAGVRFNIAGETGRSNYLQTGVRRLAIGLNTDIHVTPTTTVQLDGQHSRRRLIGDSYGIVLPATGVSIPAPISGETRLSADFGGFRYKIDSLNAAVIQRLGGDWTLRFDGALTRNVFSYYDSVLMLKNDAGDYDFGNFKINRQTDTKAGQLRLTGSVATGPFSHQLALGLYGLRQETRDGRASNGATSTGVYVPGGNLNRPFPNLADPNFELPSLANGFRSQNLTEKAAFLSDTIGVGDHWQLLLGGRYIWREQVNLNPAGAVTRRDDREKFTPTVALLYKPVDSVTVYGSYAQSLAAGGTAPTGAANVGEVQPPIESKRYELGVKAKVRGLLVNAAAFRIDRGFEFLLARTGLAPLYVQAGVQRHDGVEVGLSGNPTPELKLYGGIQVLDPKVRNGLPAVTGKQPPAVPDFQAKLYADYAPAALDGLAFSVTANYTSDSWQDAINSREFDGFFTVGSGIRYRFDAAGTPFTFRASADNLTGKNYWLPRATLTPGAPRSLSVSLAAEF